MLPLNLQRRRKKKPTSTKAKGQKKRKKIVGSSPEKGKATDAPPYTSPWFLEDHYDSSYRYSYATKDLVQPKFLNLAWLKSQVSVS